MSPIRPLALAALVTLVAAPARAATVYWCPTDGGSAWLRLEIDGLRVQSIRRVPLRLLALDEAASEPVGQPSPSPAADPLPPPAPYASRTAACYHVSPTCTAGRQIRRDNRLAFDDDATAREAGRVRCRICGGRHDASAPAPASAGAATGTATAAVSDDAR